MKNVRKFVAVGLSAAMALSALAGCGKSGEGAGVWDQEALAQRDAYLEMVDEQYAYELAVELSYNEALRSSPLGTRTAGSDAEHAAADFLVEEMKAIGLQEVEKVGVAVDKWQFNDATLTIGGTDRVIKPHSYATASTPAGGLQAEILYLGDGTMYDYEGIDVTGKIVLVDLDQRADWWIDYPMLEARLHGAAAILSASTGGFSQVNQDALNAQDVCAPVGIPCLSISVNDSDFIKAELEKGPVTATLMVDNIVEPGGVSYNVMGKIPGNGESDQLIVVGSHYDMYFNGFQDNSCAVALNLAMAKAMIESGYTPDNDIVFVIHGAEEWGASDTPFDWAVGSWRMINEARPEWVGKLKTFVNFELPAFEFGEYTSVYSAPELYSSIERFVEESPFSVEPENCFPEGVKTEGYQTYTYSDDFSYYVAGVPSTVNGFLLQEDMETVFPFYVERYHSQYDDETTYDGDVMTFHLKFYGAYVIYTDKTPMLPLDFTAQFERLEEVLDEEVMAEVGADGAGYAASLEALRMAAEEHYQRILAFNDEYAELKNRGADPEVLAERRARAAEANERTLEAFRYAQDHLLALMYERPVVPHEAYQENLQLMQEIVALLEEGDVQTAADEYVWRVNNLIEWYAMFFSPEVTQHTVSYFYPEYNAGNLFWGTGKMFEIARVEEATRQIAEATFNEEGGADMTRAIEVYRAAIEAQSLLMKEAVDEEIAAIEELTAKIEAAVQ